MTQEEKAKAYDEALEVMRQWIAPCHTKEQLDALKKSVFPELRESEDERIRKELIETINCMKEHIKEDKTQCYAYDAGYAAGFIVGKEQGWKEHKAFVKENPKTADSIPSDRVSDAKYENSLHKVGDFLPESKRLANEVIKYLTRCGYSPVIKDDLNKKHFHIDIPRHKDEFWNSEEYKHCRDILGDYYYEGNYGGDTYTLYILREKQKEQKPAEWSEEDEDNLKAIIRIIEDNDSDWKELTDWLNSLHDNYKKCNSRWKPSEEQIATLEQWLKDKQFDGASRYVYPIFESLYEQLKKLM